MSSASTFSDKAAARRFARRVWAELLADPAAAGALVGNFARMLARSAAGPGAILLAYLPLDDEADHRPAWAEFPGRVYLPVVGPEAGMEFRLFREGGRQVCELRTGRFGLREPAAGAGLDRSLDSGDIVLVPGLAADPSGRRLGRGGGFYDRWRERMAGALRVALLPAELARLDFPAEAHDLGLNRVVTELGLVDY